MIKIEMACAMIILAILKITLALLNASQVDGDYLNALEINFDGGFRVISANINIPKCINTTINDSEFNHDGAIRINFGYHMRNDMTNLTNFTVSSNNLPVSFCATPSPQLRHCNLSSFGIDSYQVVNRTLFAGSGLAARFGDYYINEEGDALTCSTPILDSQETPRCNRVKLQPDQYETFQDGSFFLKASNTRIERAQFDIDNTGVATLCYPLSIRFLNCKPAQKLKVSHVYLALDPNLILHYRTAKLDVTPEDYYIVNGFGDAVICLDDDFRGLPSYITALYRTTYYASAVCLILTIICQMVTAELTCYTQSQLCHFASLATFFISCALFNAICEETEMTCAAVKIYALFSTWYFSGMAAVFWLNVLAFHIYQTFAHLDKMANMEDKSSSNKRFFCYIIYANGMPAILLGFLLILDYSPALQSALSLKPYSGLFDSYYNTTFQIVFYLCPLLFLMGTNLVFYIATICNIRKVRKEAELINVRKRKQSLALWVKLFIFMGISMVMVAIMWSIKNHLRLDWWYIGDTFVSFQGFAIFCIVVCKKEIYESMKVKCIDIIKRKGICSRPFG